MKTYDQNKKDIQNEVNALSKDISDLAKRKEALIIKRDVALASVKAQTQQLGDDLINDRDTTQTDQALAREKSAVEGLNEAISQADQRLVGMQEDFIYKNKLLVNLDFTRRADGIYIEFLDCIDELHKVVLVLNSLDASFAEVEKIGIAAGIRVEDDDHLRNLRSMYLYLKSGINGADGIPYKVNYIENSFVSTLEIARKKKGK